MLPYLLLDKSILVLRLNTHKWFNLKLSPALGTKYFYLCSYGSGGFDEDLRDGADSMSSSSVADL